MTKKPTFKVKPRKQGKTKRQRLKMFGENITQQQFKDDCDINKIMARFVKTGVLDHLRKEPGEYAFASADTFRDSMEIVATANSMFEALPSQIRNFFENDTANFLSFTSDPKNLPKMQEMGLANQNSQNGSNHTHLPNSGEAANRASDAKPGAPAGNDSQDANRGDVTPAEGTPAGVTGSD